MTDVEVAIVVVHIVVGIWLRRFVPVLGLGLLFALLGARRGVLCAAVIGGVVGMLLSAAAWVAVLPDRVGGFDGDRVPDHRSGAEERGDGRGVRDRG